MPKTQYQNQQVLYQPRQNVVTPSATDVNSGTVTDNRQRPSDRADPTRAQLRPSYKQVRIKNLKLD